MKTAFIFPGQGSQQVGMGRDVGEAFGRCMDFFAKANEIVGYDLADICFNGPEDKLNSTSVSQPGIFVTSAAMLDLLRSDATTSDIKCDVTAGLSLGEYTALYAAGAISFEAGVALVQKRGLAMQAAADASKGSMVSIIGLDEEKVAQLCEKAGEGEILMPVNFNCPGQIVISGEVGACHRAVELAEEFGAIKALPLQVAGAFHTEMMSPAADALKEALEGTVINETGDVKVVANIDGNYYCDGEGIRAGLVSQLVQPIQWQKCMEKLLDDGVEIFYEIGPNRVLTGLMKRINRKAKVVNLSTLKSLEGLEVQLSS